MADWTQRGSSLIAADVAASDQFGWATALSQDGAILAVAADGWEGSVSGQGGVYIFDRSGTSWTQRGSVVEQATPVSEGWAQAIALDGAGTLLVVGARSYNSSQGRVYFYDWDGSAWVERGSQLTASDAAAGDSFGRSVAISGDGLVLAVGASGWDNSVSNQGGIYIYDWSGGAWVQRGSVLEATTPNGGEIFGTSLALNDDGTVLIVGAESYTSGATSFCGCVYTFDYSGGSWSERGSRLLASDKAASDHFGHAVSISADGERLVVGADDWEGASSNQGGVYIYTRSGSSWTQDGSVLVSPSPGANRFFGAVAVDAYANTLVVGAYNDGSSPVGGVVYTFDYTPPLVATGAITVRPTAAGSGNYTAPSGYDGTGAVSIYPAASGAGTFPTSAGSGAVTVYPTATGVGRIDVGWEAALSSAPSRIAAALAVFECSWSSAMVSPSSQIAAEAASGAMAFPALGIGYSASGMDRGSVSGTTITVTAAGVAWPASRVSIRKSLQVGDGEQPYGYETAEVAIPYARETFASLFASARAGDTLEITAHYTLDDGSSHSRSLGEFALTRASRPTGSSVVVLAGERVTVYGTSDDVLSLSGVSYETGRSIRCAVDHQVFPGQGVAGNATYFVTSGVTITMDAANNASSMEVFGV